MRCAVTPGTPIASEIPGLGGDTTSARVRPATYLLLTSKLVSPVIPYRYSKQAKLLARMRASPESVTYTELFNFCCDVFGDPRQHGTSHAVFKTPRPGDPE